MPCNQCGQCCRTFAGGQKERADDFSVRNLVRIKTPPKINSCVRDKLWNSIFWYRCKLLNEDGTCSIFEDRPDVCRVEENSDGPVKRLDVVTDKCGYIKGN